MVDCSQNLAVSSKEVMVNMNDVTTSGPMEPVVRIKKLLEFDHIDFWLVSGDIVHEEFDKEWKNKSNRGEFIGGHHYVFKYIPENEIWISDLDKGTDCIMIHEYIERLLMKENRLSYEDAHKVALATEGMYMGIGNKCEKR